MGEIEGGGYMEWQYETAETDNLSEIISWFSKNKEKKTETIRKRPLMKNIKRHKQINR